MKIALACHPTHGGSGVVAAELGMRLAARGHEVHFVSYERPFRLDPLASGVYFHEVQVTSYPLFRYPPYALALANELLQVVEREGVEIIHAHYAIPHSLAAVLARDMHRQGTVKVVTTLHGTDITLVGSDPSYAGITRWAIEESDRVTVVSDWLGEATRQELAPDQDLETIPNAVDSTAFSPEHFDPALRARFAAADELLVAHVSNFRPVKRVKDVVAAFARGAEGLPARLLMIGHGPDLAMAQEEAKRLSVEDRISWVGPIDDTAVLLASSDLFLLPSESESFGLAALEGMSSGLPVVSTLSGGMPSVVSTGESGFLAPVGAVDQLAQHLRTLLTDEKLRKQFSATARQLAIEKFGWEQVVESYERCYEELLSEGG
ncbi:MAG: N-acetyl-alpha-D-glucosaminyl L-malate synthase BshA [Planctomycetota bacterium]|nr:N-acetyl-alpha-D-glucosaminyl L-malate synthase BshA [Planctomycetota bacterium]